MWLRLCFQCREHGFKPWLGTKIPHTAWHGQKKIKGVCACVCVCVCVCKHLKLTQHCTINYTSIKNVFIYLKAVIKKLKIT